MQIALGIFIGFTFYFGWKYFRLRHNIQEVFYEAVEKKQSESAIRYLALKSNINLRMFR